MKAKQSKERRRVPAQYTAADRERLIQEHARSGLTKKVFCAKRGINLTTFHGWFKRRNKSGPARFAEVKLPVGMAAPIEIELPRGVHIRIRDTGRLRDVVEFVREVAGC
jgi:hypothetical protein